MCLSIVDTNVALAAVERFDGVKGKWMVGKEYVAIPVQD